MSDKPKVLAFSGSTRKDSYNKMLVKIAASGAQEAGAEVTIIDLANYPLPLYDGDLETENGLPENGRKLKDLFLENDGLLISSPEYNSSYSAVLKNTIDWVSRPVKDYPPLEVFIGKVAAVISASPGGLGGLRGLANIRSLLGNIKVLVIPEQIAVGPAGKFFNSDGSMTDSKKEEQIKAIGKKLAETILKLK